MDEACIEIKIGGETVAPKTETPAVEKVVDETIVLDEDIAQESNKVAVDDAKLKKTTESISASITGKMTAAEKKKIEDAKNAPKKETVVEKVDDFGNYELSAK